jgi:hypothetical protein
VYITRRPAQSGGGVVVLRRIVIKKYGEGLLAL